MTKHFKQLWLKALRGEKVKGKIYRKGKGRLCTRGKHYCCLGVLEDIALGLKPERYDGGFCYATLLDLKEQEKLIPINDHTIGWSKVIAYIQKHVTPGQ